MQSEITFSAVSAFRHLFRQYSSLIARTGERSFLLSGDKILFFQKQDGEIVVSNASSKAIRKAQSAFTGAAETMSVASEDDIQALVDEVRKGTSQSALGKESKK